jgi:hypothetical protein
VPDLPEAAKFVSSGCDIPVLPPGGINIGPGAMPSKPDDRPWKALKESGLLKGWI